MATRSQIEQLNDLAERLFGMRADPGYRKFVPPFDLARPNIHDSKKAFLLEQGVVENVRACLSGILMGLRDPGTADVGEWDEMQLHLGVAIETSAKEKKRPAWPETPLDVALQSLVYVGFFRSSLAVIEELDQYFSERSQELKRQEKEFWTVKNRPPNYYARTIALRFAKLYAKQRCVKPTFGTSKDGAHPSTDFGRALEEVFKILEIKANLRRAGEWAIGELTEQDWKPRNLLAGIFSPSDAAAFNHPSFLGAPPPGWKKKGK